MRALWDAMASDNNTLITTVSVSLRTALHILPFQQRDGAWSKRVWDWPFTRDVISSPGRRPDVRSHNPVPTLRNLEPGTCLACGAITEAFCITKPSNHLRRISEANRTPAARTMATIKSLTRDPTPRVLGGGTHNNNKDNNPRLQTCQRTNMTEGDRVANPG